VSGLRFHWRLAEGRETREQVLRGGRAAAYKALPELEAQRRFCTLAEDAGIDSLLVDINFAKPEPLALALALSQATRHIRFLVAHRPGLMSPTLFTQQVNTFSALSNGRISLNLVAGHSPREQACYGDFLAHDERYRRMEEFLAICHGLWRNDGPFDFEGRYYRVSGARLHTPFISAAARRPEVYVAGASPAALETACRHGSCWVRFAEAPQRLRPALQPALRQGIEVCLRLSLIARPTREEALQAARELVARADPTARLGEQAFVGGCDAQTMKQTAALAAGEEWLTPCLWTGAVPIHGAPAVALVGSPQEVARGILDFAEVGVTQFIFSGWPKSAEMQFFGENVLPLVRALEASRS